MTSNVVRLSQKAWVMESVKKMTFCAHDALEHNVSHDECHWVLNNINGPVSFFNDLDLALVKMKVMSRINPDNWTILAEVYV